MSAGPGRAPTNPLYLLVVLVALGSTAFMAARFAVLLYAVNLAASPATIGLLSAMFALVAAFTSVPTGRLIDRGGVRRPLVFGTAMLTLAVAAGAAWRDLPVLFLIAVFAGVAYNIMVLALQRLAGELGPAAERAAAFGLLGLGFSLANLGAPVATGLAIDHLGFTATFSVFAMLSLAGFVFVWTDRLPWPPAAAGHAPGSARANAPARTGTLGLLRAPGLARLYACCALFECAWMGFGFMLPIHGTALGLNASRIGLVVGAAGVMLVITRSFMTQLLRRFTPWQLLLLGMALVGWGYIGLASAGNFGQLVASGTLIGLGQGITGPMLNALIYEFAPPDGIGAALGLRTLINNVSQAGMPLLAGAAGASLGFTPVFWALAAGMLAMTWSSRGQWRRGRRGAPRPPRE